VVLAVPIDILEAVHTLDEVLKERPRATPLPGSDDSPLDHPRERERERVASVGNVPAAPNDR